MTIQNIIAQLAEAQSAIDQLPELRSRIEQLNRDLNNTHRQFEELGRVLEDRDATIADLNAKLSSVEVERDSYGFRALDAEEKLATVLQVLSPHTAPVEPVTEVHVGSVAERERDEEQAAADEITDAINSWQPLPETTSSVYDPKALGEWSPPVYGHVPVVQVPKHIQEPVRSLDLRESVAEHINWR
jgi:septal ring factor EnvC (AmiA/AmiB activator)